MSIMEGPEYLLAIRRGKKLLGQSNNSGPLPPREAASGLRETASPRASPTIRKPTGPHRGVLPFLQSLYPCPCTDGRAASVALLEEPCTTAGCAPW
jgi:hypothetical protein